jgi:trimeric autotransporter adhesin
LSLGAIPALQSLTSLYSAQISKLFELSDRDRRDARRGTSAAVALVAAPMPSNVGGVSYTLNAATFRGEQAFGLSLAYRANTENAFAVVAGVSYAGGKSTAARVGLAGEF